MKRFAQARVEWLLLAVIAAVCAVLSLLQYRWTGELSRAEPALLRADLNEHLRRLTLAFGTELRESCTTLLPDARDVRELGSVEAHRIQYARWVSSHERSLFGRIGIAVPAQEKLGLYGIDGQGRIEPMEWPSNWESLRSEMTALIAGRGHPPSARADSDVIEVPLFSDRSPSSELEWMIFDLNEDYVRTNVMPRLLKDYLNPIGEEAYDVSVAWATPGGSVVFSTRSDHSSVAERADASAGIFSADMGPGFGRGRGRGRERPRVARWIISVRHREGSLDAAVAQVRQRNLFASVVLVFLLGSTAWALVRYTARSRRLSDMQFRFAAGVSHDLRTPLTAIRGAAFNVAEGVVEEPTAVKRYAKLILRNAEELTSMIENVLAFSASLHSEKSGRSQEIAIGDVIRQAAAATRQEIEQAGCNIEVTVAPDLPIVAGDPVAVELAFRNLIGNAVRHGGGGKWIGVSAGVFGDGVEVRVSDHGPGIPEAEQRRIFEPFYRCEQTLAGQVSGTGLGLNLAKNTIERHKGTIEVRNSAGGGAQFIVRLPVRSGAL